MIEESQSGRGAGEQSPRLPPIPDTHAKSLNPGRLPPRVFLVGNDPNEPPIEAMMYWCRWNALNPKFDSEFQLVDQWPEAVPRLRRTRIEIHEPARPFDISAFVCDGRDLDTDSDAPGNRQHAHTAGCRYAGFGDSKNAPLSFRDRLQDAAIYAHEVAIPAARRWLAGNRARIWPKSRRFDRDDMASDGNITAIDLLPRRQLPIETVELTAMWQERLIPKSEAQLSVPDTDPVLAELDPNHPDVQVWAHYAMHFDNR